MFRVSLIILWIVIPRTVSNAQEVRNVQELWADFDPRRDPLEIEVIREWQEDGGVFRHVRFLVGVFRNQPSRMTAVYGYPLEAGGKRPAVMHIHGGGQRGSLSEVKFLVARGYAALSVNWGGSGNGLPPINALEGAQPDDPNTDWGVVDPTQLNVSGYASMLPGPKQYFEDREHPKNNNWYLLTLGCRRALTFLEQQPEVNPEKLGVHGFSMGGNLTMYVAATDGRVKAAVPAVGGQGWRWEQHEFLSGEIAPQELIRGDIDVFRKALSFESYAPLIGCPVLHRSATNDFHGWMDDVYRTNALISQQTRYCWTPHKNHRISPEVAVAMPLWFDHFLNEGPQIPRTPESVLDLKTVDRVPTFRVKADSLWPVQRCEVYYSVDPDPRARFWRSAEVVTMGNELVARLPVHSSDMPLFAFSNVYHQLPKVESMNQIPGMSEPIRELCLSSQLHAIDTSMLKGANPDFTLFQSTVIEDFQKGLRDWYVLNAGHLDLRELWTRKVTDPIWQGQSGDQLRLVLKMQETNHLSLVLVENEWRQYRGPRRTFFCTREIAGSNDAQELLFSTTDFREAGIEGSVLSSWRELDLLGICAGYNDGSARKAASWKGPAPEFVLLEWLSP